MKKLLVILVAILMAVPSFAQKLTKEEKAAQQQALYETMVKSIEDSTWAYVPTSYVGDDGVDYLLSSNVNFITYEKNTILIQGFAVCNNNFTNIVEVRSIEVNRDKKGKLKSISMVVVGRHIHGTYKIIFPKTGNEVDVIFTQSSGPVKRSRGPIVPVKVAIIWKTSNPE